MSAHCKNAFLAVLFVFFSGASCLAAGMLKWVHVGTIDAGLVNLTIDGNIAYRKMPPGKSTPWGNMPPGPHQFQISTDKNPGTSFDLEIGQDQRVVIVSASDKNGDLQSRAIVMDTPPEELFVLNMMHGSMLSIPDTERKAIFGKGLRIPLAKEKTTVGFADAEGLKGELDFSIAGDVPQGSYFAILSSNDEGQPQLAVLRERDSLFEMGAESIEIPGEFTAAVRIITARPVLAAGGFDPANINWENVDSRIFWLNLMIGRDPCRLEISGFPAMRRMPSGRGSGFVKWPAGDWDSAVVVELTNEKIGDSRFSLSPKSSLGLISSGGGKYPHRLVALEGRSREENSEAAKPRIRLVNALPAGTLRSVVQLDPEPLTLVMQPGEISKIIPLAQAGFPGAKLDFTLDGVQNQPIVNIPAMPDMPSGDWVIIVHLDQESFASPVLTWVEMDKGSITVPTAREAEE
jgi:hypothetical protein